MNDSSGRGSSRTSSGACGSLSSDTWSGHAIHLVAMAALDDLVYELRPAAGDPDGALILMHGRGTSEQDLAGLLDVLDPERRLVGACPRGPLQLPPSGFHWYVVPRVGFPDHDTFHAS